VIDIFVLKRDKHVCKSEVNFVNLDEIVKCLDLIFMKIDITFRILAIIVVKTVIVFYKTAIIVINLATFVLCIFILKIF
jgi:hypothetical protein